MRVPVSGIVTGGRSLGRGILARSERNKHRHCKYPERVLFPRILAYLCWGLFLGWAALTTIGWLAFDETSDPGDLATRWAFYPFGMVGVLGLLLYYNSYVERHADHVVYRTWLRRTHRIDYKDIVAFRILPGQDSTAGIRVWTTTGRRKFFQLPVFGMNEMIEYLATHDVEDRTKKKRLR